jgi:hypothetical protein
MREVGITSFAYTIDTSLSIVTDRKTLDITVKKAHDSRHIFVPELVDVKLITVVVDVRTV